MSRIEEGNHQPPRAADEENITIEALQRRVVDLESQLKHKVIRYLCPRK